MGQGHQFAAQADPDIAMTIGQRRMEQGDVGADGRNQGDGVGLIGQGVLDDLPVGTKFQQIAAENAAQRQEGHAFLGGLEAGMQGRAGGVLHAQGAIFQGGDELMGEAIFPQRDGGGL